MNRAALRALRRVLRRKPYRGRRRKLSELIDLEGPEAENEEQWIRDLLPPTPPAPAPEPAEAWAPRITRWIRVTFPLPDDTMLLPAGTAAMVLELMATDFVWDPR